MTPCRYCLFSICFKFHVWPGKIGGFFYFTFPQSPTCRTSLQAAHLNIEVFQPFYVFISLKKCWWCQGRDHLTHRFPPIFQMSGMPLKDEGIHISIPVKLFYGPIPFLTRLRRPQRSWSWYWGGNVKEIRHHHLSLFGLTRHHLLPHYQSSVFPSIPTSHFCDSSCNDTSVL